MFSLLIKDLNLSLFYKLSHLTKELFIFLFLYLFIFIFTCFILFFNIEDTSPNASFLLIPLFGFCFFAFVFTVKNSNSFLFQLEEMNRISDIEYNFIMKYKLFYNDKKALWHGIDNIITDNVLYKQDFEFIEYINFLKSKNNLDKYELSFIDTYNRVIDYYKNNLNQLVKF